MEIEIAIVNGSMQPEVVCRWNWGRMLGKDLLGRENGNLCMVEWPTGVSSKTRLGAPDCKTDMSNWVLYRGMSNSAKRKCTSSEDCRSSKLRSYSAPQGVQKGPISSSINSTYLSTTMRPNFRKVLRKSATHTAECCRLVRSIARPKSPLAANYFEIEWVC